MMPRQPASKTAEQHRQLPDFSFDPELFIPSFRRPDQLARIHRYLSLRDDFRSAVKLASPAPVSELEYDEAYN